MDDDHRDRPRRVGLELLRDAGVLPADAALWGAAIRALPAGLLLLLVARLRPARAWWWRSALLGAMNVGAFFALIYLAAQQAADERRLDDHGRLAGRADADGVGDRGRAPAGDPAHGGGDRRSRASRSCCSGGGGTIDPLGVAASVTAMVMSAAGYVLAKRWSGECGRARLDGLAAASPAALLLLVPAASARGAPPRARRRGDARVRVRDRDRHRRRVRRLVRRPAAICRASTVGLVGLLNPVTGVLLGTLLAGELLTWRQALGIALVLGGILGRAGQATQAAVTGRLPAAAVTTAWAGAVTAVCTNLLWRFVADDSPADATMREGRRRESSPRGTNPPNEPQRTPFQ